MTAPLENWLGREETQTEFADAARLEKLSALLDNRTAHWQEALLPPLAHWLYCQPAAPQSNIGEDGHVKRGGFIPPIDLPRRMWASSDVKFHAPLGVNQKLTRRSKITALQPKKNKRGEPLIFLTIRHDISDEARGHVEEMQHIVYKSDASSPPPSPPSRAVLAPEASREVQFDIARLFRFSALTFNAHRIHFDRAYAKQEGYAGLVVHGPYLAFLLLDHFLASSGRFVKSFHFRAERPLFDGLPAKLCCAGEELWIEGDDRAMLMRAKITPQ